MSWSKTGMYDSVDAARAAVAADASLPEAIKDYIEQGLQGLVTTGHIGMVEIEGSGHVCVSGGSYQVTSCQLKVTPKFFAAK